MPSKLNQVKLNNCMKISKTCIINILIFLSFSCKETPILYQFESDTDELIREFVENVDDKMFYAYMAEKEVYVIDYIEKKYVANFSESLGYWRLSNGVKITVLSEDIVKEIHSKLLLAGELRTGGIIVVKFRPNGKIDVIKGQ